MASRFLRVRSPNLLFNYGIFSFKPERQLNQVIKILTKIAKTVKTAMLKKMSIEIMRTAGKKLMIIETTRTANPISNL